MKGPQEELQPKKKMTNKLAAIITFNAEKPVVLFSTTRCLESDDQHQPTHFIEDQVILDQPQTAI